VVVSFSHRPSAVPGRVMRVLHAMLVCQYLMAFLVAV